MTNKYIKNDCSSVCFHTKLQSFTYCIYPYSVRTMLEVWYLRTFADFYYADNDIYGNNKHEKIA